MSFTHLMLADELFIPWPKYKTTQYLSPVYALMI